MSGFSIVEWVDIEHDGTDDEGKPVEVEVPRWTLLHDGQVLDIGRGDPPSVEEAAGRVLAAGLAAFVGGT